MARYQYRMVQYQYHMVQYQYQVGVLASNSGMRWGLVSGVWHFLTPHVGLCQKQATCVAFNHASGYTSLQA